MLVSLMCVRRHAVVCRTKHIHIMSNSKHHTTQRSDIRNKHLHLSRKVTAVRVRADSKVAMKGSHWFERIMACIGLRTMTSFGALFVDASASRACHALFIAAQPNTMHHSSQLHTTVTDHTRHLIVISIVTHSSRIRELWF